MEGQEVKAVLDTGEGVKDGNAWDEIQRERLLEWRPAASKGELVKAGHELMKECNTYIHMDISDKDITDNVVIKSSVEDLLLVGDMEEKDVTEKTRKGVECATEGTNFYVSRTLVEDYIQSFPLRRNVMFESDSVIRGIEEDRAERDLLKRAIDIFVESDDVTEELKKIDRKEGNGADISIPGYLGDVFRSLEKRRRTKNKGLGEILRKHVRWRSDVLRIREDMEDSKKKRTERRRG